MRGSSNTDTDTDMLKLKIGQICCAARQSRPDIVCDISIQASSKHATVQILHCGNKLVRKLRRKVLEVSALGKRQLTLTLVVFIDSSMEQLPDEGLKANTWSCLWERMEEHLSRRDFGTCGWH